METDHSLMRLLFLTPRLPFPPDRGGEITVFNFLKQLSRRHEIALVSFYDRPEEMEYRSSLERYCARVEMVRRPGRVAPRVLLSSLWGRRSYAVARHTSREFRATVRRLLETWRADVAQIEIFFMGGYLPELGGLPTVLDMHNVTWLVWERMAAVAPFYLRPLVAREARLIRRDELAVCGAVDVCVPVSQADLEHLASAMEQPFRSAVVTPGVDCDVYRSLPLADASSNLVFVGSMNYVPNIDAVEFFARDILPRVAEVVLDVTFTIVGARPTPGVERLADDPRVRVTGFVDDVRPYYAAAAASVVPLRIAGGIRMKILEAMALGSPIVSTTIGAEGLGLEHGRELLIADGPQQFADATARLLRDAALRHDLARRARETAVGRFSWEAAASTLEDIYRSVSPRTAHTFGKPA